MKSGRGEGGEKRVYYGEEGRVEQTIGLIQNEVGGAEARDRSGQSIASQR